MRRISAAVLLLLLIGCSRPPAASEPKAPAAPPREAPAGPSISASSVPPNPAPGLRVTLHSIENSAAEVTLAAPDERRYTLDAPFCGGREGNPMRSGHYAFSVDGTEQPAVAPFGDEVLTFNDTRRDMLEVLAGRAGIAPDLLLARQYASCNGSGVAALALTPDGRRLVHLRWRREDGSAQAVLFASAVEALSPGVIRTRSYNNAEGIWSTVTWTVRPDEECLSAVKTVRTGLRDRGVIRLGAETYTLPMEAAPGDLVWAAGPDRIVWAVSDPWASSPIRATARRPGGGDLSDGAVDLLKVSAGLQEGGVARITSITLAENWLVYTVSDGVTAPDPAPAPGSDRRQPAYRILAANLANPSGGSQLLASIAAAGPGSRLQTAVGGGYVAWQNASPVGPGARYALLTTTVHRLADGVQWEVPGLPRADSLRIQDGALVATLPDGGEIRRPLSPTPPKQVP